jgi:hypothetical protein
MRSRLQEENIYHVLVVFSLDVFLPVFDRCFAINCSSHVRLRLQFQAAANLRRSLMPLALRFGMEIRLL